MWELKKRHLIDREIGRENFGRNFVLLHTEHLTGFYHPERWLFCVLAFGDRQNLTKTVVFPIKGDQTNE